MGDVSEPKVQSKGGANGACSYQRCHVPQTCPFDCLAITAPNPRASKAYLEELVHRVGVGANKEGTREVLILAVSDPEGVRIGSGGGTLNAILEVCSWNEFWRDHETAKVEIPQSELFCFMCSVSRVGVAPLPSPFSLIAAALLPKSSFQVHLSSMRRRSRMRGYHVASRVLSAPSTTTVA